jgi:hypothetical protein
VGQAIRYDLRAIQANVEGASYFAQATPNCPSVTENESEFLVSFNRHCDDQVAGGVQVDRLRLGADVHAVDLCRVRSGRLSKVSATNAKRPSLETSSAPGRPKVELDTCFSVAAAEPEATR